MEKMFVTILMNVESDLTIAKDVMVFVLTKKVLSHVHVILDMLVTVITALIMMNARLKLLSETKKDHDQRSVSLLKALNWILTSLSYV